MIPVGSLVQIDRGGSAYHNTYATVRAAYPNDTFSLVFFDGKQSERVWKIDEIKYTPPAPPVSKGQAMLSDLRSYVKENRQLLYTIALVVALDHFLFNGAFRERIKGLVESLLSSAEKKIG